MTNVILIFLGWVAHHDQLLTWGTSLWTSFLLIAQMKYIKTRPDPIP